MANYLKGSFLGIAYCSSFSSAPPVPRIYDKVTFMSGSTGCIIDKVWGRNRTLTKTDIDICSSIEFSPKWDKSTYLLSEFEHSVSGGNVANINTPIKKWLIYRTEKDENQLKIIGSIDSLNSQYIDYTACKDKTYQYWLFGQSDTEVSSPLISNQIDCNYNGWYLIDVENKTTYIFSLNQTGGELMQNENFMEYTTNLKHNLFSRGNTDFLSGSLQALVGEFDEDDCSWNQTVDYLSKLKDFIMSDRLKYIKDIKGRIFRVITYGYLENSLSRGIENDPRYIQFSFKEIGEVDDGQD